MIADTYDLCGNANSGRPRWHVLKDDCIGTDARVITDVYAAEDFGARADIHVSPDHWRVGLRAASANRHLLENDAVGADDGTGIDHDAIRMQQKHPAPDVTSERDIGASDYAPKAMLQHPIFAEPAQWEAPLLRFLIGPDRTQQAAGRIP